MVLKCGLTFVHGAAVAAVAVARGRTDHSLTAPSSEAEANSVGSDGHHATQFTSSSCADSTAATSCQGLTLVHFSAQRKRFVWSRGCI